MASAHDHNSIDVDGLAYVARLDRGKRMRSAAALRAQPPGEASLAERRAAMLGLEFTLRGHGRPRIRD